jgi:hypothetical protein
MSALKLVGPTLLVPVDLLLVWKGPPTFGAPHQSAPEQGAQRVVHRMSDLNRGRRRLSTDEALGLEPNALLDVDTRL